MDLSFFLSVSGPLTWTLFCLSYKDMLYRETNSQKYFYLISDLAHTGRRLGRCKIKILFLSRPDVDKRGKEAVRLSCEYSQHFGPMSQQAVVSSFAVFWLIKRHKEESRHWFKLRLLCQEEKQITMNNLLAWHH